MRRNRGKLFGAALGFSFGGPIGALLGTAIGHLVDVSDDGSPAGGTLPTDFVDTARHEQDLIYWLKAPGVDSIERWFFNIFVQGTEHAGGGQPKAFTISVPEPVSLGTLTILMAGQTDTDHEVKVAINGTEQSFMWSGISYYEATVSDVNRAPS